MHVARSGYANRPHPAAIPVSALTIPGHSPVGMSEGSAPAEDLLKAMMHVAATLRDAGLPYLLAGSFAVWARGGPIHETDLDFAVKRDDVERAIAVLEEAGLERMQTPEEWLAKVCDG